MRINSLGGGRQSIFMEHNFPGEAVVFADTMGEPQYVYDQLEKSGIKFEVVSKGNLMQDVIDYIDGKRTRVAQLPFFSETGLLMRQCTFDYKIAPIRRFLRFQRRSIDLAIGISLDEIERMKVSDVKYIQNIYPLIENRISLSTIIEWYKTNEIEIPHKSACVFCPFHNNHYWKALKKKYPEEFEKVCEFDEKIRVYPKMRQKLFIHRSLKPLRNVDFDSQQVLEFPDLLEECHGLCGL